MRLRPKSEKISNDEESHLCELVKDLEDKKRVETIIGEDGGGYWDLIENSKDLIQSVKPDMHYFYVNKAWRETLGYTNEEAENLTFLDIIHPDCHKHCFEIFQKLMMGERQVEVEVDFVSKDGETIELKGTVSCHFENGVPVATRGVFESRVATDISENNDHNEDFKIDGEIDFDDDVNSVEDVFLEFHDLVTAGSGYNSYSMEFKDPNQGKNVVWK